MARRNELLVRMLPMGVGMTEAEGSAGDSGAFREDFQAFYAHEFRSVAGLAYVLMGSRSGAEDLAQEAFLAAFHKWDHVSGFSEPGAWVRRVVANRAVSWFRRRSAEARALVRLGHSDGQIPEIDLEAQELWEEVRRLPRRQAQVIALHYLDQRRVSEIGCILECSENTVKTHLQRGRDTLARRLDKEQP
jgi:RNA polymerase sigma factor (sigma-70 family)